MPYPDRMKKYFTVTGLLFAGMLFLCSCTNSGGGSLSPSQFKSSMEKKNAVLVDVRTPEEFSAGHIANAVLINFQDPSFESTVQSTVPKDAEVLLYCRSGRRSADAKALLLKSGYTHVVHLDGGINAWMAGNFPVEK